MSPLLSFSRHFFSLCPLLTFPLTFIMVVPWRWCRPHVHPLTPPSSACFRCPQISLSVEPDIPRRKVPFATASSFLLTHTCASRPDPLSHVRGSARKSHLCPSLHSSSSPSSSRLISLSSSPNCQCPGLRMMMTT